MIRALRRRFILGTMLALTLLLALLIGGVTVVGYLQMERSNAKLMNLLILSETQPPDPPQEAPVALDRSSPAGYHLLTVGSDGKLQSSETHGAWTPDKASLETIANEILSLKRADGVLDNYQYQRLQQEDGAWRILLLERSPQLGMLKDTLRVASLLSLFCLVGMFLILLPLSSRLVRSYAVHIEKQKRFITDAGHEIKTPVAIILSNVDAMELLQGESKWSRNIRGQVNRLSALLQQLLFMARIDERSVSFSTEEVDLAGMIREEAESYAELFQTRGLRFEMTLDLRHTLHGNRETLRQLLHILLDNAAQYANEGGRVWLNLSRRSGRARLSVRNTVDALPDCPPDALFERFFRADTARTQSGGGCGVGLSAAAAIAEMHRGKISAAYEENHIVRFTAELPL